jgi:hypothetical protein
LHLFQYHKFQYY